MNVEVSYIDLTVSYCKGAF